MKKIILILLFSAFAFAKSSQSCYTVQLFSQHKSEKNRNLLQKKSYPTICRIMEIGKSLTVRCGCYEKFVDAKSTKSTLSSYRNAKVVTTYKYRFDNKMTPPPLQNNILDLTKLTHIQKKKRRKIDRKPVSQKDQELRLMLQVFLYKGDLKNAYKVASVAYKEYPNSYYWNQKMAEVCKWTNRSALSMKHMRFIYDIKRDPKIEKELIDYGISAYQYDQIEPLVVNRAIAKPTEKNIDLMIFVYKRVGAPEEVVKVLEAQYEKNPSNTLLLTKALELSLEMGDMELAKKYVNLIEGHKPYSKVDASLISRYYYVTHDVPRAYASLLSVKKEEKISKKNLEKYYQLKSDLGWYLQKNLEAAEASRELLDINASRLNDYERINYVYQKKQPKLTLEASRRAFKEYKFSYLFYSYANGAITNHQYDNLNIFVQEIDASSNKIKGESLYWLLKAKLYHHYHKSDLEKSALIKAYELDPDNFQIKQELLWFYMAAKDYQDIRTILSDISESDSLNLDEYFTLANAYFFINEVNHASYYTQELLAHHHPFTKSLEFKFLQAYIYQVQGKESSFSKSIQEIVSLLSIEASKNPALKHQDKFLSDYLRAAMHTLNPDKFEKKLKKARPFLSQKNYEDIAYSWAIQNRAYDKSFKIYHHMKKHELWASFSNALVSQNSTEINNMLALYLQSLSRGDAAQAAQRDGQISLAQSITFEALYHNSESGVAYIQHLDLSKKRSDKLDMKISYAYRKKYTTLSNSTYLTDGYYLNIGFDYYINKSLGKTLPIGAHDDKVMAKVGLKKLYNRGEISLYTAYHKSMLSYMEYGASAEYRLRSSLNIGMKIGKNMDAQESTKLLLTAKKDMLNLHFTWNILNSTSINFLHEFNSYISQDEVTLGEGSYDKISIKKQIHNGYPDMSIGTFYDRGRYNETIYRVLPHNFYDIGVSFSYGMVNSNSYTRVWRPYFEFTPYYNSEIDNYTYGLNIGYGGKLWYQDHLVLGASYTANSIKGAGKSIVELFLNYQFLYYHP